MYEVLQAVITRGGLRAHDVLSLALTCREYNEWVQPWVVHMHRTHLKNVRDFSKIRLETSIPWVNVHVSEWGTKGEAMKTKAARSVRVFVDRSDPETLRAICEWLGSLQLLHLYFLTYNMSKAINSCLTDAMLEKCCEQLELLCIPYCTAVTDHTIRRLVQCQALTLGRSPGITHACMAALPSLLHVHYASYDPDPPCDPIKAWLQHREMQGMLKIFIC